MKKLLVEATWGVGLFALILVAEFLVTLPFESGLTDDAARLRVLAIEFGLTAPCALVLAFALARARHTGGLVEGTRRGLIWLAVVALCYLGLALGNTNQIMLTVPTLYVLLACVLLGSVAAGAWAGRRPGPSDAAGTAGRLR